APRWRNRRANGWAAWRARCFMKPVELRLKDFGAFRGEAVVDFRRLGALFLICGPTGAGKTTDWKSTRLNSSHSQSSYAVFCLKKKTRPSPQPRTPAGDGAGELTTTRRMTWRRLCS